MRVLRVARCSARKAGPRRSTRCAASSPPHPTRSAPSCATSTSYRLLERAAATGPAPTATLRRHQAHPADPGPADATALEAEVAEIDAHPRTARRTRPHPSSSRVIGVGTDIASALLVAAGDNPERLRNEATFAHLCGVAPIDASSGKHERHRLNRGGDRQANSALWRIVITRMVYDPRTRDYIERRTKEGLTKKEAIRCLKRYIAREVYNHLPRPTPRLTVPRSIIRYPVDTNWRLHRREVSHA